MFFTLLGISIVVRRIQFEKAYPPILSTLEGIVIIANSPQFSNAESPIYLTVLGIATFESLVQPQNVLSAIPVVPDFIGVDPSIIVSIPFVLPITHVSA